MLEDTDERHNSDSNCAISEVFELKQEHMLKYGDLPGQLTPVHNQQQPPLVSEETSIGVLKTAETNYCYVILEEDVEKEYSRCCLKICRFCCRCERGYSWYNLQGKGCGLVIVLVTLYIIPAFVMIPLFILYVLSVILVVAVVIALIPYWLGALCSPEST